MRQLGLLEGSSIFGDEVVVKKPIDKYRTRAGELKSLPLKAIAWYIKLHGLSLKATSVYPTITFGTPDGLEQGVTIQEIVEDYEGREKKNRSA